MKKPRARPRTGAGVIVAHPKPAELVAIRASRCGVIEASAGTGKTYTLEHLVVDLILDGVPAEALLVVTFTEKATNELTRRVRDKLGEVLRAATSAEPATDASGSVWLIDDRGRKRLSDALAAFDQATITTIHGFCQRVLTENAFASDRLFRQELGDERALFDGAFRDSLRRDLATSPDLRPYLAGHLRTGTVDALEELLFQAADVSKSGCPVGPAFEPQRLWEAIAAVRAAALPGESLRAALAAAKVHANTARAVIGRVEKLSAIVGAVASAADLPAALAALEEADGSSGKEGLLPFLCERLGAHASTSTPLGALVQALRALDEAAVPFTAALVARLLPPVRARLAQRKRAAGLLDFGDMLTLLDESLGGPDGPALIGRLRRRYRAALIDEFQDTDEVQWRIFSRLFLDDGAETAFYVIGDPKQSIYGFRGADVQTYLHARDAIVAAGGSRVSLARNFRSTEAVLAACHALFGAAGAPGLFRGDISYDENVACGRPEVRLLDAGGDEPPPVTVLEVQPRDDADPRMADLRLALTDAIAAEISTLLAHPPVWHGDPRARPFGPSDIFILTRSAKEGLEAGEALRRRRIPHAFYKQEGLFDTDEAAAVEDVLAALAAPGDAAKRLRALLTPFFGLSLEDLEKQAPFDDTHPLAVRLDGWRAIAEARDYERLFARIVDDSGFVRRQLYAGGGERAVVNVQHIFELLLEEVGRTRLDVRELRWLLGAFRSGKRRPAGMDADVQRLETEASAVQIMTMHKAKGLEAAVVFVCGGFGRHDKQKLINVHHAHGRREAHIGRLRDVVVKEAVRREQDEEDERLLYVALTRAKARLYLPVFDFGGPGGWKWIKGTYAQMDARLRALRGEADGTFRARCRSLVVKPDRPGSFDADPDAVPAMARTVASAPDAIAPRLLAPPPLLPLPALRTRHAGAVVTSYSQLKALHGGYVAPEEIPGDDESRSTRDEDDDLPGGTEVGVFLHRLLETVPLESFGDDDTTETWAARRQVRAFFDDAFATRALPARLRPRCERLVHVAMTTALGGGDVALPALARLPDRPLREVEMLYPAPGGAYGFIKGVIDAVARHRDKAVAIDWKSDRLPAGISAEGLARHVAHNYDLQARLYAMGVSRMLGVTDEATYDARFGGLLYVFLRGVPLQEAVVRLRPSWAQLQRWTEELAHDGRWRQLAQM